MLKSFEILLIKISRGQRYWAIALSYCTKNLFLVPCAQVGINTIEKDDAESQRFCNFFSTFFSSFFFLLSFLGFPNQSQSRYGLETRPASLFYLFVRVCAELCTVKTMNFWYNEAIVQQRCLAEAFNRTIEILISKISKICAR